MRVIFLGNGSIRSKLTTVLLKCLSRDVCEIAEVTYENFQELSKQYPDLSYAVFAQLVRRLKNTTRKVTDLAFIDVSGRIARCLIDLSSQPEAMILPNGRQIRITRQEIGRIVGCSREMVGRVLKTLEEQGMIETDGKAILIFDASLRRVKSEC